MPVAKASTAHWHPANALDAHPLLFALAGDPLGLDQGKPQEQVGCAAQSEQTRPVRNGDFQHGRHPQRGGRRRLHRVSRSARVPPSPCCRLSTAIVVVAAVALPACGRHHSQPGRQGREPQPQRRCQGIPGVRGPGVGRLDDVLATHRDGKQRPPSRCGSGMWNEASGRQTTPNGVQLVYWLEAGCAEERGRARKQGDKRRRSRRGHKYIILSK